jgi:nucleoside-diphosphate-sugar epimerase
MAGKDIVIVTGSSGFIGSSLARALSDEYTVIGFDRPGPPDPPKEAVNIPLDLTSDEAVLKAMQSVKQRFGQKIASVVHLAAYYDFSGEPSDKYEQITVRGTRRLLGALQEFEVEQFIFSSSMLVHAPCQPGQAINEDWPLDPKWDYPKSKATTEEILLRDHGSIPLLILRIAGVYDDQCHSIPLANQMQRIHEQRLLSHVFPGDTMAGQSFVHLEDVISAVQAAVARRSKLPEELTLLIGEPGTMSYEQLQRAFGRLIHGDPDWSTKVVPKEIAKVGAWLQDAVPAGEEPFIKPWMIDLADDHYKLDISRAHKFLDWYPRRSLRKTLPEMVKGLLDDPLSWYEANGLSSDWLKKPA